MQHAITEGHGPGRLFATARAASFMTASFVAMLALSTQPCLAAEQTLSSLTWDLTVGGKVVGQRTTTIRDVDNGTRVVQTETQASINVGVASTSFQQRLTGHIAGSQPASFHSVVDQDGSSLEVQGRWQADGWRITLNNDGNARTTIYPLSDLDISTVDMADPQTRFPLARFSRVHILFSETGEVLVGDISRMGHSTVTINQTEVAVDGYRWQTTQGPLDFYYNADGILVQFETRVAGLKVGGKLTEPPPPGSDDFAVPIGRPSVEIIDL